MPSEVSRVSVRILEKDYFIACPQEERADLLDAAQLLNLKMREVRESGKVIGTDRIAVMVALNLANDMLKLKSRASPVDGTLLPRVRSLREKVDRSLARTQPLDL